MLDLLQSIIILPESVIPWLCNGPGGWGGLLGEWSRDRRRRTAGLGRAAERWEGRDHLLLCLRLTARGVKWNGTERKPRDIVFILV